ncbi:MAG: ABC transporter permease [Epulopiscium sp. Nele67-Bin002]|nr:MAG: ABC transporter permease [Epulopiscium sp. Nuni2H_MBin001]OON91883.1 MAG: ABC transporter permease [Epulopiscium sp. Nele67-Bin002]OON91956.1 MAG: ABC transporter permease [Epulopiscium sp. Nele67-Bin001]
MDSRKVGKVVLVIANIIVGIVIILPLLYALSLSFMPRNEIVQYPPNIFPSVPTFDNYRQAVTAAPLFRFMFNSLLVSISVMLAQIVIGSMTAYGLVFFEFKGKQVLFFLIVATMMIPGEVTIISNYLTVSGWGLNDSYLVLILPFLTSAMGIFMIRQFYLGIPKELQQAAQIDGCGSFMIWWKIVLPISKPIMASLGIYAFISTWNQYLWPLLTINDPDKRTVQVGISMLQFAEGSNYGVVLAGAVIILLPSLIVFGIGQKALVKGMTAGAVKG